MKLTFGGIIEVDIELTDKGKQLAREHHRGIIIPDMREHLRRKAIINAPFPPIMGGRVVQPKIWAGTIVGDSFYGSNGRPDAKKRAGATTDAVSMAGYIAQ